jgi:enoyl-CoA hydratase/carnithine racemase
VEYIKYSRSEKVVTITINRPDKLNALNPESMTELSQCWEMFKEDASAWVAVLTGEGRAFSAGMDMKEGIAEDDLEKGVDLVLKISPKYHSLHKPTIAAIKGHCLGLGWWLAMECDLRVASEDAKLGIPETRFNMSPIFGGLLSDHLPPAIALEVLLTADPLDSKRAYEMGFLNRVVKADEVDQEAVNLALRICRNPPTGVQRTKEMFYESLGMNRHGSISLAKFIHKELQSMNDAKAAQQPLQKNQQLSGRRRKGKQQ